MTRTSREVIQVFLVFCLCIAWLFAWCYSVNGQLWQHTSNSHLMNSGAAVFHRSFGKVSRDTKTKKQVFWCFSQDWWGGRGQHRGGQKGLSAQVDAGVLGGLSRDGLAPGCVLRHLALCAVPGAGAWLTAPAAGDDRELTTSCFGSLPLD